MSNMKKLVTGVAAVVLSVSSAFGASALSWRIKGYETDVIEKESFDSYQIGIVYEQYGEDGHTTGVIVGSKTAPLYGLKPYAKASFSAPITERVWPNREYVRVFADGADAGYLYTGTQEQLQYRDVNFMWELAAPHRIYTRTQAFLPNEGWYTDATYPVTYASDVATVKANYDNFYGFGLWKVEGDNLVYMPVANPALVPYTNTDDNIYYKNDNDVTYIAKDALKANAVTNMTGMGIKDIEVKKSFSLVVSGPKYNFDGTVSRGNEFAATYSAATAAASSLNDFAVKDLVKHIYSHDGSCAKMKVEWVDAGYEAARPNRYYQILKVDNVLLDGRAVAPGINRPYVYRYIIGPDGTYATADINYNFENINEISVPAVKD
ncbi:MAG: hypothetical protein ACOYIO_05425 [Eubacteriales bacterium]|jgi:hypothetical protein